MKGWLLSKPKPQAAAGQGISELRDEITGALVDPARPLVWRRAMTLARHFELRQGDAVVGGMEPSLGTRYDASGECLGRSLDLSLNTGLFRKVKVESALNLDARGPSYDGLFWGWGRVMTVDGDALRWRHGFTGLYTHLLLDSDRRELLRMRPTFLRFGRRETKVELTRSGWGRSDLAELVLLTWFLRLHTETRGRRVFK